jgi:hypothetical protein
VIDGELDQLLAARRATELLREARRARLAAAARPRRSIRFRLGSITVLIEHQPRLREVGLSGSPPA